MTKTFCDRCHADTSGIVSSAVRGIEDVDPDGGGEVTFRYDLCVACYRIVETAIAFVGDGPRRIVPDAPVTPRAVLLAALANMPDEAFGWFVGWASGAMVQFPDGLGGFRPESRAAIAALRAAADVVLNPPPATVVDAPTPAPAAKDPA